ncbi:MAG: DUF342 domain-containing protein [Tepidisphaera sp.]|nr:DUF342 domain-containing protein [Tepidisphaera sp.]
MSQTETTLRVDVSPDGLSATLVIAPQTPKAQIDAMHVQALLAERGIAVTPMRVAAIDIALASYQPSENPTRVVIAQGQAPAHGQDGAIELLPEVLRPPAPTPEALASARAKKDSHRTARIVSVQRGQPLGQRRQPTPGTDGVDVRGRSIAATPGRASPIKVDASVQVKGDGTLLAAHDGVVELEADLLRVSTTLKLDCVDFSTGHVDFPCDVLVMGEVRDGFRIHAARDLEVRGLIDAANIDAGRDVRLVKGMACPKGGSLECGRDLFAACLNNVTVQVARDATIEKELQDCRLLVGRRLIAPRAAMLRGELMAAGGAELDTAGCESHTPTLIIVGHTPRLDDLAQEIGRLAPKITQQRDDAAARLAELSAQKATSHKIAERQTELRFMIDSATSLATKLCQGCERLIDWSANWTRAELIVRRELFPGLRLVQGPWTLDFHKRIVGPVKFHLGPDFAPLVSDLAVGRTYPASDIAKVSPADRMPDLRHLVATLRGDAKAA